MDQLMDQPEAGQGESPLMINMYEVIAPLGIKILVEGTSIEDVKNGPYGSTVIVYRGSLSVARFTNPIGWHIKHRAEQC